MEIMDWRRLAKRLWKTAATISKTVDEKLRTNSLRHCPECGKKVVSLGYQVKRYCNNICYQRFQRARTKKHREPIFCHECNKLFTPKRDNHYRCSESCRKVFQVRYLKRNRQGSKDIKERHPCQFCGQLFVPSHYLITFCSKPCKRAQEAKYKLKAITVIEPTQREITEDDLNTSNHAAAIEEFKEAGGKVKVYPSLPGPKVLNTGSTKGSNVDQEWSVKDIADLDEYEDIFNMKN